MRLLIVSQNYWPSLGGAEIMLGRLADEWTRQGHAVAVVTCRFDRSLPLQETRAGVRILRMPFPRVRFPGTLSYIHVLSGFLLEEPGRFDAVYVSMLKHGAFAAVGALEHGPTPVILRAEGAGSSGDVAWQRGALFGGRIARRCRAADAIVAPSPAVERELCGAGYASEKVRRIPNAAPIPAEPWNPSACAAERQKLGLPETPTFVYTGRLHENKGLGGLVQLLPAVARETGPIQLVLVGDGPRREKLNELRATLPPETRVHLVGRVDDVEPYLRAADVFVLPSKEEGLSVALLEALAIGLPCVASDIPANTGIAATEILPLVSLGQPAAWVLALSAALRPDSRTPAAIAGRRDVVARDYRLEEVARRHVELFAELHDRRAAGSKD